MPLFGTRATSALVGLGVLASFTGVLAAGSSGPGATRYAVNAPLMFMRAGPTYACFTFDLMGHCAGIPVRGATLGNLPIDGLMTAADIGIITLPVRLVGSWDGTALTLTQAPEPAPAPMAIHQPCEQTTDFDGNFVISWQSRVWDDPGPSGRGLHVMETMPCDRTTLGVLVAVADETTVKWLSTHYPSVRVAGWLQLEPTGF